MFDCLKIQSFSNIGSFIGFEFALGGFLCNVWTPNVFPTSIPINANEALQQEIEEKHMQRELEKEQIRRQMFAREMGLAIWQDLGMENVWDRERERDVGVVEWGLESPYYMYIWEGT